jgi:hypothetical protein
MPWRCRLVDKPETKEQVEPGDMWYLPAMTADAENEAFYTKHTFSPEYLRDHRANRPPLMVALPDGEFWMVDQRFRGKASGWTVTGSPPAITARPSIVSDGYHGWLTDGVLSDDLEGRTYGNVDS